MYLVASVWASEYIAEPLPATSHKLSEKLSTLGRCLGRYLVSHASCPHTSSHLNLSRFTSPQTAVTTPTVFNPTPCRTPKAVVSNSPAQRPRRKQTHHRRLCSYYPSPCHHLACHQPTVSVSATNYAACSQSPTPHAPTCRLPASPRCIYGYGQQQSPITHEPSSPEPPKRHFRRLLVCPSADSSYRHSTHIAGICSWVSGGTGRAFPVRLASARPQPAHGVGRT
ncbi:hypothetical protein LZ30DRAFT_235014 [Colletotrichum cereale]|nr:hypothetical protein LZ30DRAFT_235014 [Colletotrichum cereale]